MNVGVALSTPGAGGKSSTRDKVTADTARALALTQSEPHIAIIIIISVFIDRVVAESCTGPQFTHL